MNCHALFQMNVSVSLRVQGLLEEVETEDACMRIKMFLSTCLVNTQELTNHRNAFCSHSEVLIRLMTQCWILSSVFLTHSEVNISFSTTYHQH